MSNVHPSRLPFGLKVKPARHYFPGGSIYFEVKEGKLYYSVSKTTKHYKFKYPRREVTTKEQLDKLIKVKSENDIPLLTEVASQ